jgi:F-type H+-transporting ATPase subunit b
MPVIHTLATVVLGAAQAQGGGHAAKGPNPILPEPNEVVWGSIAFFALFLVLRQFAFPAIQRSLKAREDRIRADLEAAEAAKAEARGVLSEYRQQLANARNEAGRIIEEARQAADELRRELRARAEAEAVELRNRAQADIEATVAEARAELERQVADFAITLAEKIVERSLDRQAQQALIERYIEEVGAMGAGAGSRH